MPERHYILLAEDDGDLREALTLVLEDAGHTVVSVGNGREALEAMTARRPCLLLLDLMMPVMSGWGVVTAMKLDPLLREVPVCVLTAVAHEAPVDAACVLDKPVDVRRLLATIASLC